MTEAGFYLEPGWGKNSVLWTNQDGLKICLDPEAKMTLKELVRYVTDNSAHFTRKRLKYKVLGIDGGAKGFVK